MDGRSDAAQSQFARPKGVNKLVMKPADGLCSAIPTGYNLESLWTR
ncbi:MAG: hypothetical protein GX289_05035 [Tissierellia bacterium]|nr:hypothetical protein [Tissierellia bacterium]